MVVVLVVVMEEGRGMTNRALAEDKVEGKVFLWRRERRTTEERETRQREGDRRSVEGEEGEDGTGGTLHRRGCVSGIRPST